MQFIIDHFTFENLKRNFCYMIKTIINGSGNIGVFVLLSIITVATFESLGLSNRETNLEHRLIQNMDLSIESLQNSQRGYYQDSKVNIKSELKTLLLNDNTNILTERLKLDSLKDTENRSTERVKILFEGALEQFLYENKENFPNSHNTDFSDKYKSFNKFISNNNKNNADIEIFDV